MGGASSEASSWPSLKAPRSGGRGSIIITAQDSLETVLARVGLTEYRELFQVGHINRSLWSSHTHPMSWGIVALICLVSLTEIHALCMRYAYLYFVFMHETFLSGVVSVACTLYVYLRSQHQQVLQV